MVTPLDRAIEKYIDGLPDPIQDIVTGNKPATLREAKELAATLTDSQVRKGKLFRKGDKKRTTQEKSSETKGEPSKSSKKRKASKNYTIATPIPLNSVPFKGFYRGKQPRFNRCNYHHPTNSPCRQCTICGLFGHLAATCRIQNQAAPTQARPRYPAGACFNCGDPNHFKRNCPRLTNVDLAHGRVFNVNEVHVDDQALMII